MRSAAFWRFIVPALLALLVVVSTAACVKETVIERKPLSPLVVSDETSDLSFSLVPTEGGARVVDSDGASLGTLAVSASGLRLTDASGRLLAQVVHKADGYQLNDGDGVPVLRARGVGNDVKLMAAAGQELGVASLERVLVAGEIVSAVPTEGGLVVGRAGRRMMRVEGDVAPGAAAMLGLVELSSPQRIALLAWRATAP